MFRQIRTGLLLLCALVSPTYAATANITTGDAGLDDAFAAILDRNFDTKAVGIDALAASGHPAATRLLRGILKGDLRVYDKERRLVWFTATGSKYALTDALDGKDLGLVAKRKAKKIAINNQLRSRIRTALAALELGHADPEVRLTAAREMLSDPDPMVAQALRTQLTNESDTSVRAAIVQAIALGELRHPDPAQRLQAIDAVRDSLEPAVRNQLQTLATADADPRVRETAVAALEAIDSRVKLYGLAETLFFGLSLGSVLVLAAIGLAITFGVMGVINMAHGELIMLGAYTTYLLQLVMPNHTGLSVLLAIPTAFVVSGLAGIAIERGVIRFLYGRPLETLLATFGISLILQQLVRTLISPQNVPVSNPEWMSGFWQVNSVLSLTYNRLYILLFCGLVFTALFLVLKKTKLGLQVRAVSQNRSMARAMGVRSARVDALTFGLGSGIAGVAGVALSQLTNVGPNLGQAYIVDSFMVVVFGGVGNLWGTLIGGLSLGIANKVLEPWSGAVLAKILVLVFIILFIQKRPRGLFPQKGRAAEG